jgi:copper(I)-binding protein/sulfur relay (sulfurtransferase) complex TusBCD TusD component (DsrE family)
MSKKHTILKWGLLLLAGLLALSGLSACKTEKPAAEQPAAKGAQIEISGAWSRSTPEMMAGSGIVYMVLNNTGGEADRLVAGKTPAAEAVELHEHTMDDQGVMRMRRVEGGYIEIPAGGSVELKPGGLHVMLVNLTSPLETGSTFPLTLKFEQLGEVTIEVPVRDGAMESAEAMEMTMAEATVTPPPTEAPPEATATTETVVAQATEEPAATRGPVPTPRAPEDLAGGLFVSLTTDDIDRAAMAIGFATKVLNGTEKPATIFLNTQGVRLADTHIPQNTHKSGKTIHQMLQKFMDDGGVVLLCPVCMKNVGGISEAEVLPGIIIGTPEYTWSAMFAENVTVLSY